MEELINYAISQGYSDIHLAGGTPFVYRQDGIIHVDKSPPWSHREIDALVSGMLTTRQLEQLKNRWSVDVAFTINRVRLRVNVFNTTRGLSLAIRVLPEVIPSLRSLNLHPSLQTISKLESGLVLVCGATGSGKSTTISAIIEEINQTRPVHIITLEDPIEYRFQGKMAFIEQREIGVHVPSFKQGLTDALRENPDVILVGELREPETIRLSLSAAEAGHLVFATLHATDAEDAIYRLSTSSAGEAQESNRYKVASTISWLIVQQMAHIDRMGFRVPLLSILRSTPSIRSLIRENKLTQIETAMQTGRSEGMFTMERYQEEFINSRDTIFMRPYKVSRSAEGTPTDDDYLSPLIDPDALHDVVYMANVDDKRKKSTLPPPSYDPVESRQYEIDDAVNLEDLIAQMGDYRNSNP